MNRTEAWKLLGGHATGTLTEAERRTLYAAALAHQDLFDALADEEALRELLADPAARAQLLTALALPAAPRIVPFWRRPELIGAAAGLMVAATAGLAVLRSPETAAARMTQAEPQAPADKAAGTSPAAPAPAQAPPPAPAARKVAPKEAAGPPVLREAPAPSPAAVPEAAYLAPGAAAPAAGAAAVVQGIPEDAARSRPVQAEARRAEARDNLSRKAAAEGMAGALFRAEQAGPPPEPRMAAKQAPSRAAAGHEAVEATPGWIAETLPDGATQVTVAAPRAVRVYLLRRGTTGVEVLVPRIAEAEPGAPALWRFRVRLAPGDTLDLYRMNGPVADPAALPAEGSVDGLRTRIHPAGK